MTSVSTPRSIAASTVRRSARVPARCPSATGSSRLAAQRPFPSMMIATDRATSSRAPTATGSGARRALDLEDLRFLALEQLVDLLRVLVGQLLDALLGAVLLVLPDLTLVHELLAVVHDVAA